MTWNGLEVFNSLNLEIDNRNEFEKYLGMAYRHNPKRAHLLVSKILGKHIPQKPSIISNSAMELSRKIKDICNKVNFNKDELIVFAYAETATNLGALISKDLQSPYFHSTRYPEEHIEKYGNFHEEHSHASSHEIRVNNKRTINSSEKIIVLVDDELTTGKTIMNTIKIFEEECHHNTYIVASLTDMRDEESHRKLDQFARSIDSKIFITSLLQSHLTLPNNSITIAEERMNQLSQLKSINTLPNSQENSSSTKFTNFHIKIDKKYPKSYYGVDREYFKNVENISHEIKSRLTIGKNEKVLVLGNEEDMYPQFKLAEELEKSSIKCDYSTTTLSPIFPYNSEEYAIRSKITYTHNNIEKYCYNLNIGDYDTIIFFSNDYHHTMELEELFSQLRSICQNLHIIEFKENTHEKR